MIHTLISYSHELVLFLFQARQKDGSQKCRNPKHPASWLWSYETFQKPWATAIETLEELGYARKDTTPDGTFLGWDIHPVLLPGTWHPPTEEDSTLVATIPLFQVVLGSQTNVQVCSSNGAICYVTKYVTKSEEGRQCMTKAEKDETIRIQALPQYNVGRSSSKIAEERIREQRGQGNPMMMEVSSPQMSMHTLDLSYYITNVDFIFASTFPLESRRAGLKVGGGSKVYDLQYNLIPVTMREALNDPERQFTQHQQILIRDFADSPFIVDATTSYSLRSPELIQFIG